jgi:hypothetical protein
LGVGATITPEVAVVDRWRVRYRGRIDNAACARRRAPVTGTIDRRARRCDRRQELAVREMQRGRVIAHEMRETMNRVRFPCDPIAAAGPAASPKPRSGEGGRRRCRERRAIL